MRLAMFLYGTAYMYYNLCNKNIYVNVTSVPRRHLRGSAWRCHVALRATSHPRRLAINAPIFCIFLIISNVKKSKINLIKIRKIP